MGIGLAVARHLAERGDRLILLARGADELEAAVAELAGDGHEWRSLDVSDEAAWASASLPTEIHGLVCAAALMEPIGAIGEYATADFRRTLEVNVVGTLLAVERCLAALRTTHGSVVTFGGGGATGPLPRFDAYATSKAAVARLTENLAPTLDPVRINCVAPGFVATRLHQQTLAAGPNAAGRDFYERTQRELERGGFPAETAAELVSLLLSGVAFSGKLISAQWDPWQDESFRQRLASDKDLATVRRIDGMLFSAVERQD
jgi:NAD(P)-dependent dehydrogenase (short-subunit alcohol dehydrogenase family)